jgi:hypothetical protein
MTDRRTIRTGSKYDRERLKRLRLDRNMLINL